MRWIINKIPHYYILIIKNLIPLLGFLIVFIGMLSKTGWLTRSFAGTYYLESDGHCHFLPHERDTLILKEDGTVISKNFEKNATYQVKRNLLDGEMEIIESESASNLLIQYGIFFDVRLRICADLNTFYVKRD